MRSNTRRSTPLLAGVLLAVIGAGVLAAAGPDLVGRPAPEIRLPTAEGKTLALSDLKGQVVLVDFWASWCPPCVKSFPALNQLFEEFGGKGLRVVAVNVDQRRKDADAFLASRQWIVDVVFDTAGAAPRAYALQGMPSSFLIGRDGKIRFEHVGFSESVLAAYRREITELLNERQGGLTP